jgi:hypothetical protein
VPGTKLLGSEFLRFWVSFNAGRISVGTGAPGKQPPCYTWLDPSPQASIQHVGLSSWDHHVAYRNIQISGPPAMPAPAAAAADASPGSAVASLQDRCMGALQGSLSPAAVCTVLGVADVMRPAADVLRDAATAYLAEHLPDVLAADPRGLQALSFDCMLELLSSSALVCFSHSLNSAVLCCLILTGWFVPGCLGLQWCRVHPHIRRDNVQGCEESVVFAAVAAWARCHAELARLAEKLGGRHSPAACSPHAWHSPRASDDSSSISDSNSETGDPVDMLPDPALDQ